MAFYNSGSPTWYKFTSGDINTVPFDATNVVDATPTTPQLLKIGGTAGSPTIAGAGNSVISGQGEYQFKAQPAAGAGVITTFNLTDDSGNEIRLEFRGNETSSLYLYLTKAGVTNIVPVALPSDFSLAQNTYQIRHLPSFGIFAINFNGSTIATNLAPISNVDINHLPTVNDLGFKYYIWVADASNESTYGTFSFAAGIESEVGDVTVTYDNPDEPSEASIVDSGAFEVLNSGDLAGLNWSDQNYSDSPLPYTLSIGGALGNLSSAKVETTGDYGYSTSKAIIKAAGGSGVVTSLLLGDLASEFIEVRFEGNSPTNLKIVVSKAGTEVQEAVDLGFDFTQDYNDYVIAYSDSGLTITANGNTVFPSGIVIQPADIPENLSGKFSTYIWVSNSSNASELGAFTFTAPGDVKTEFYDLAITPVVNPISVSVIPSQNVLTNQSLSLTVNSYFTEANNAALSFTATLGDGSPLPDWLSLTGGVSPLLIGSPGPSDVGTITVELTATNNSGDSTSGTFDIIVQNGGSGGYTFGITPTGEEPPISSDVNHTEKNVGGEYLLFRPSETISSEHSAVALKELEATAASVAGYAEGYTDSAITQEVTDRNAAIDAKAAETLISANNYVDSKVTEYFTYSDVINVDFGDLATTISPASYAVGATLQGQVLTEGRRVFFPNLDDQTARVVYEVTSSGLVALPIMADGIVLNTNLAVRVNEGDYANHTYALKNTVEPVIGTDNLTWEDTTRAQVNAGTALNYDAPGNSFNVAYDSADISVDGSNQLNVEPAKATLRNEFATADTGLQTQIDTTNADLTALGTTVAGHSSDIAQHSVQIGTLNSDVADIRSSEYDVILDEVTGITLNVTNTTSYRLYEYVVVKPAGWAANSKVTLEALEVVGTGISKKIDAFKDDRNNGTMIVTFAVLQSEIAKGYSGCVPGALRAYFKRR